MTMLTGHDKVTAGLETKIELLTHAFADNRLESKMVGAIKTLSYIITAELFFLLGVTIS